MYLNPGHRVYHTAVLSASFLLDFDVLFVSLYSLPVSLSLF